MEEQLAKMLSKKSSHKDKHMCSRKEKSCSLDRTAMMEALKRFGLSDRMMHSIRGLNPLLSKCRVSTTPPQVRTPQA